MDYDSRKKIDAEVYERVVGDLSDHHLRGPKLDVRLGDVVVWLNRCEEIILRQAREQLAEALMSSIEKFASEWVVTCEAAEILGVSRIQVEQLIKEGQLKAERIGNSYFIERANVVEMKQ